MDKIKLSKISSIVYGYPFDSKLFSNQSNGFGIIRIRDIKSGFTSTFTLENNIDNKYLVKNGDILIGMDGEFNISRWKGNDAYLNQRVCKISSDIFVENFLCYSLHNKLKQIEEQTSYVTVKHLSSKILENILIENYNLQTQQQIVEELDCLSDVIEKKKQQLADLDNLIKSQFIEMFGDLKNTVRLGDCCDVHARIGWQSLTTKEHMQNGDFILITGTDFKDNEINYSTCVYVSKERYEMDPHIILRNDDVLITKDGTIGKVAVVHNLPKPATLNGGVFVVRPDDRFNKEYISYVFKGPLFESYIDKSKTGATIKHLNQKYLVEFKIPIPSNEKQEKFAIFSKHIDNLKFELKQSIEETQKLFNERMQHYFGE